MYSLTLKQVRAMLLAAQGLAALPTRKAGKEDVLAASFYQPPQDSEEVRYALDRREALGGFLPQRRVACEQLAPPDLSMFADLLAGTEGTWMNHRFTSVVSPAGQQYRPVDAGTIAPYREAEDGQILQEGICETGAMASFLAAGTAYANHGLPMIPFYIFYSMFGFQRVGDMVWACGDMMCKGFLLGGTSGRTTLNGEGVQHQDGHSHLIASTVPNLKSYDPAFAYELVLIVQDGIRRMYGEQEDVFYYLTVTNQNYPMPAIPEEGNDARAEVEAGVLAGMYCFDRQEGATVNLFGSGAIMTEVMAARAHLDALGIASNLWSVTSYNELMREGMAAERAQLMSVGEAARKPLVAELLENEEGVFVAASDYMKALPLSIARWVPGPFEVLGTDGFGLSEDRHVLREYFEVSAEWVAYTALSTLAQNNLCDVETVRTFANEQGLNTAKVDPFIG